MKKWSEANEFERELQRGYRRKWRLLNPDKEREQQMRDNESRRKRYSPLKQRIFLDEKKKWYREYKKTTPCFDCGGIYPEECMEFDHLTKKGEGVSAMIKRLRPRKLIEEEIKKCQLVCANCHRIRTVARRIKERDAKSS